MTVLTESLAEEKAGCAHAHQLRRIRHDGRFTAVPIQEQTGEVDLNCRALLEVTYGCLPYMRPEPDHSAGEQCGIFCPSRDFSVYAATKSFVLSFSKALRAELKERQIYDGGLPRAG